MLENHLHCQLHGWSLTTAEITYRMPDHRNLLQSYVWQEYDLAPRFPRLVRSGGYTRSRRPNAIGLSK